MAVNVAVLRSQIETALAGRIPAPFYRRSDQAETTPFNIPEIDQLTGGLPLGSLTEISGPSSSGRATLMLSALASRTAQSHACALVDGRDTFDPHSARAVGVELERLLWVRCRNINQCLQATDLVLQGGGFGLVAVDLSALPPKTVRYVPLNVWFRFRRAVENTPTILLLLDQETNAGSCASLVLRLALKQAHWRTRQTFRFTPFSARLFDGSQLQIELVRSRRKSSGTQKMQDFVRATEASLMTNCKIKTPWSDFRNVPIETK